MSDQEITSQKERVTVSIPCTQIVPWSKNPRTIKNARYDDIKQSLLANGFQGVFVVTKEPKSESFIPFRGGNTTIEIIHELYNANERSDLNVIVCKVEPWPGLKAMKINAHLENTTHGAMCFADEANSVVSILKEHFGSDDKHIGISSKVLVNVLAEYGIKLSQEKVRVAIAFCDRIEPYLTNVSSFFNGKAGFNYADVKRIITIGRAFDSLVTKWQSHCDGKVQTFTEILSDSDESASLWSFNKLASDVVHALSRWSNLDYAEVKTAYDLTLDGDAPSYPSMGRIATQDDSSTNTNKNKLDDEKSSHNERKTPGSETSTVNQNSIDSSSQSDADHLSTVADELQINGSSVADQAQSIAKKYGLEDCFTKLDTPIGFYMEVPEGDLTDLNTSHVWWFLFLVSHINENSSYVAKMPSASELRKNIINKTVPAISGVVGKPLSGSSVMRVTLTVEGACALLRCVKEVYAEGVASA